MPRCVFNHYDNSGVGYWRMWMQEKWLKKNGWNTFRFDNTKPYIEVDDWEDILPNTDIFVNQQLDNPEFLALTMAMRDIYKMPIVAEIDDDMYNVSTSSPAYKYFHKGSPVITMAEEYLKEADALTVTTQTLAELYEPLNKNIYVLPNAIDHEDWPKYNPKPGDPIIIGWAGSPTHFDDLKIIHKPLFKLLRKHKNVIFRVMGCLPDFMAGHPQIELRQDYVDIMDWPKKLASLNFDIGLAPLTDTPFNRGKSNLKWLEYSTLGIPTVLSRVGEYKNTVTHKETGFLAGEDIEWFHYMDKLVTEPEERVRIGGNAKQKVKADFNIKTKIKDWDNAYRDIINRFKP